MATFDDFKARPFRSVRDGALANFDVASAKREASLTPPGKDLSDENLAKARAEGWSSTGGPRHRPTE
jgi:hypothetical protein